jgi:hypothetical protein
MQTPIDDVAGTDARYRRLYCVLTLLHGVVSRKGATSPSSDHNDKLAA